MGIVIVGAGHAAGQAAASIRQEGYEGDVTILGDEPHIPYQRPPLSKQYLQGEQGIERVYLRPEKFYADKNITVRTGVRVDAIDRAAKMLTTSDGEVAYDKLLLATGSRARQLDVPGADLDGIHYLRTIGDVDDIRTALDTAKRVVIVGGGYIGLEVAAVCIDTGHEVTVVEMEERILARVTTPPMSSFYHDLHTGKGVTIATGVRVSSFEGDGHVERVSCTDGSSFEADLVVVGVGVVPNVELAEAAGLECDNGIVVDDHAQTSDPDIYAAGDCTNHPNALLDRRLRLESVPNAMEQSRVAAANLLGGDKTYSSVPWFWSDQYDLKLQMVGFSTQADHSVHRGDPTSQEFAIFYFKDGVVIAADAVNSAREFMVARQLVGKQVDPDLLANPDTELKSLL